MSIYQTLSTSAAAHFLPIDPIRSLPILALHHVISFSRGHCGSLTSYNFVVEFGWTLINLNLPPEFSLTVL